MKRARLAAAAGLLAVSLAACSGGSGASPSATPSPSPTPAATPVPGSGAALPSIGNSDPALEALIPDTIDGITLHKQSMKASDFMSSGQMDAQSQAFLNALGVPPSTVSVAFGFGADAATQAALGIFAFKAPGAGAQRLLSVFETTAATQASPGTGGSGAYDWQSTTVGGKQVREASEPSQPGLKIYLYATNDVLFLVTGSAGPSADAIKALP